jgi:hypothetical protein
MTALKRFPLAFFSCISYFGFIFKWMDSAWFSEPVGGSRRRNAYPNEWLRMSVNANHKHGTRR